MALLKRLLSGIFLYFEKLKGKKTVYEIRLPKNALGHLTGLNVSGYEVRIYCQKKQYKRSYDNRFIPDKYMTVYNVFSVVSSDAPEKLRDACELEADIPCQLSSFIDDDGQKDAAIQAYLDLLAHRLNSMPEKPTA